MSAIQTVALNGLAEETFQRPGTHSERGQITLLDLLRIYTEHGENHARQICTVRDACKHAQAAASSIAGHRADQVS